jgi:DNA-binding MarR family transcriptional regulator
MKVRDCIFFQLTRASLAGTGFASRKVEHLGVTSSQAMVLNFLGEEDGIPQHVLGQKVQITSATMTGILDRLEKMDLIERRPQPGDRRAYLACLTKKGIRYAKEIHSIMVEANKEFLSTLSQKESQTFRNLLKQVWEERP